MRLREEYRLHSSGQKPKASSIYWSPGQNSKHKESRAFDKARAISPQGETARVEPSFRLHETKVFEGCAPKCLDSKRSNLDQIVDTAFILPRGDYRDG